MTGQELAEKIAHFALNKKGKDIVIMDLQGISDITDFFVIVSSESDLHTKTLAHHVEAELQKEQVKPLHREGFTKLNWVLLDYVDVVLHIFRPETRDYYALERLWADAKTIKVVEDAGIRVIPE